MKRVVVLGATSMLGREVERQLRIGGIEVIRAGRSEDSDVVIDLGSGKPPVFSAQGVADSLIHCAASFGGDHHAGIRLNIVVNVGGAADVLEIAASMNIRHIVYAGSLFSDSGVTPGEALNAYGFSKQEAERALEWGMQREGKSFCSLRLPQLWDTDGDCCRHQPWFGRIIAYASRGLTLNMPAPGGKRNFMHVVDAARLLVLAASNRLTGVHLATHPTDIDMHELALAAYRIFGCGGDVIIDSRKVPFKQFVIPHMPDTFEALSYMPQISPTEGIELIRDAGTASRFGPVDVQ